MAANRLAELERYIRSLPREIALAVEPRHAAFYSGDSTECEFDALLAAGTVGVALATVGLGVVVFNVGLGRYTSGSVWTAA